MKKETLNILNNKGQKLAVYIFRNKTDRLVFAIPGLNPFDDIPDMDKAYKKYFSLGNSVCYFDTTGTGRSEGEKGINLEQVVEDIGSILEIMAAKYKKIILYGPSLGAIPAMIAAVKYKDKNIVKLIHINGLFYLNKHITLLQKARIMLYFISNRKQKIFINDNLRPDQVTVPTLIVYGEKDSIVNPEQSRNMYEALQTKKEILAFPNGDHFLLRDEYIPHAKRLFEWLSK